MVTLRPLDPAFPVRVEGGGTNFLIIMNTFDSKKNEIYHMCQASINMLNTLWRIIKKEELYNEQFVLDWLDKVNEISIRN